jgi:hypothetical protein
MVILHGSRLERREDGSPLHDARLRRLVPGGLVGAVGCRGLERAEAAVARRA